MSRTTTASTSPEVPPLMAHEVMLQRTGKTFREWANILHQPVFDDPSNNLFDERREALSSAIAVPQFEDVLSQHFGASKKITDADKIFPRQCRLNDLITEFIAWKMNNKTNKPEGFSQKGEGDAQWTYYVKNSFECYVPPSKDPSEEVIIDGITQKAYMLYEPIQEKNNPNDQDKITIVNNSRKTVRDEIRKVWEASKRQAPYYQPPVTCVENAYIDYIKAHIRGKEHGFTHRGRDDTFNQMKLDISSSFPKALIAKINAQCPTCKPRVDSCSKTGEAREKVRDAIRKEKRKAANDGETRPTQRRRVHRNPPPQPAPMHQPLENHGTFGVLLQQYNTPPRLAPMYQSMENNGPYGVFFQQYNIPPQPAPMYQPMENNGPYGVLLQQFNTPPQPAPMYQPMENNGQYGVFLQQHNAPVYYPPQNDDLGAADFQVQQQSTPLPQPWINNTPAQSTSTSQHTQNNGPDVPYWFNMGSGHMLVCPTGHILTVLNFWLEHDGTVREWHRNNQGNITTLPLEADFLPNELFDIALPPGVSHYSKPDAFTIDFSKQRDWYNQSEINALQRRLRGVLDDGLPTVQDNTMAAIDPNESYPACPFGSPPPDPSNDTITSVPAPDNNTAFIDPQLLSNSNVSNPSSSVSNLNSADSDTGTTEAAVDSEENKFQRPLEETANVKFGDLFFGIAEEARETKPASPSKVFYEASHGRGLVECKGFLTFPTLPTSTNAPS
jgi:hypothetical protein